MSAPTSTEGKTIFCGSGGDSDWLEQNRSRLRSEFLGEHIAIKDGRVVGHNTRAAVLLRTLRESGIDPKETLIVKMPPASRAQK